jgi:hypothetical protein
MMRAVVLVSIAGCATATADRSTHDSGTSETDAPVHHDAPLAHDGPGSGGCGFTGDLATWELSSQPGSEVQVVASTMGPGVVASALSRSAAITAASGSGSINSTNWPSQAQPDPTKYYKLTIAPPSGCTITLTGLAIDLKASSSGPAAASIATSVDAFVAMTSASTAVPSTPSLTATSGNTIELRIYGFSATTTGGTLRVQNALVVHGSMP